MGDTCLKPRRGIVAIGAITIIVTFIIILSCIASIVIEYSRLSESIKASNEIVAMKESEKLAVIQVDENTIEVHNRGGNPTIIVGYFRVDPSGRNLSYFKFNNPQVIRPLESKRISLPHRVPIGWLVGIQTSVGNVFWEGQEVGG